MAETGREGVIRRLVVLRKYGLLMAVGIVAVYKQLNGALDRSEACALLN